LLKNEAQLHNDGDLSTGGKKRENVSSSGAKEDQNSGSGHGIKEWAVAGGPGPIERATFKNG